MELKYPVWQLSLALAFWGWQSDMLPFAGVILLLVALSKRSPWRWEMGVAEFHRIGDLTAVLGVFALIYVDSTDGDTLPVYAFLRWLPVLSLPLFLGQLFSMGQLLPLSAMFYSMRRYGIATTVDIRLPYAFLCLLAAGSGNPIDQTYYVGILGFVGWVLWSSRPKRQPAAVWLLCFALVAGMGYGIQLGLEQLQTVFEEWAVDWFATWEPDPFKTRTAIGDRGMLKLSSRVILRVTSDQPLTHPLLLREAAYDRYAGQQWTVINAPFQPYPLPHAEGPLHLTVLHGLARHSVLLAVPSRMRGLEGPLDKDLTRNRLGTIKWMEAPPVVRYRIAYDPHDRAEAAPSLDDVNVSQSTRAMLEPLAQTLGLHRLPPEQAVAAIADFFNTRFAYSLELGKQRTSDEALEDFLYRRHTGHCEYFAAATALLLRTAAIPSRYVVGYSVQEYDPAEHVYLVRQRHAHAWAEAYVNGVWLTVDNTPSRWAEEEAKADPWWQALADVWTNWAMDYKVWQWDRSKQEKKAGIPWWAWLVIPLAAWLGWRLYRSRKRMASTLGSDQAELDPNHSQDDGYNLLVERLLAQGHPPRNLGETPLRWVRRLGLNSYEDEVLDYYRRRYKRK